ncbi:MAG: 3-phenylpropionate/trans-cinnamate dioxygenase ferredoxin reductase component [Pseudonocardiales bacterium]|nr:3-phenylpropionate/trans-cinnamate dioxygenase ferredoxin reductase component [Pseudonocardiales bacterium]
MAQNPTSVVIVGGGLAGAKTAEALREQGYAGPVTLVSAEDQLPYERPPLSKGYLAGKDAFDDAVVHPAEWYAEHDVTLRLGTEVAAVHPDDSAVELAGGERLEYGALVLATGSAPRRLPIPGADTALTLRTRADSDAIRATFGDGKRLVIVGAGWIGLEVAAAARDKGTTVTVLESADLPLLAVLGREMATVFADLHREHGVDLRFGVSVAEIAADGVRLADGAFVPADAVLLGVGAAPRTELAERAGLDTENGVLVDASLRTSDPAIWAVGDIASQDHPVLGRRVRVEHWATALNQPAVAAAAILGTGTDGSSAYTELPYFFSDQYDLGMEYVGLAGPDARVVTRGDVAAREFVAFWLDGDDHVLASMNVNVWDVVDEIKPLISERRPVDVAKLTDAEVPYAEVGR